MDIQKSPTIHSCKLCHYNTSNSKDYNKHLLTNKHKGNVLETNGNDKSPQTFFCQSCDKYYKTRAGLWKHMKLCTQIKATTNNTETGIVVDKELVEFLIKQNAELMEIIKNGTHNTTNSNNNNTINKNKTFNLQFFLNETCKDALNITDFVSSIQLQLKDLENTAKDGYVSGISNIIIKELKDLEVCKRPIHCSDLKRETLYIKDNNAWEKENEEKIKMKQVIKEVANKNIKQIPAWQIKHPHHKEYNHADNQDFMNLLTSCMAGDDQEEDLDKIIKNLSKEVVIDK
jgi:hypothetical protein